MQKRDFLFILVIVIIFAISYKGIPPQIPFYYSLPDGENQLADWWFIFFIPISSIFFSYLNNFIRKKLYEEDDFVFHFFNYVRNVIMFFGLFIFLSILMKVSW